MEWQYSESINQVSELLIHQDYLSQMDLEICCSLDIETTISEFPQTDQLQCALIEHFSIKDKIETL